MREADRAVSSVSPRGGARCARSRREDCQVRNKDRKPVKTPRDSGRGQAQVEFTEEVRDKYLRVYAKWGAKMYAAEKAGVSYQTIINHRKSDLTFAEAEKDAYDKFREKLERTAVHRAAYGVDEPIYYKGELVGYVRRYSDTLLISLLKAHIPEKFKDNALPEGFTGGVLVVPADLSIDEYIEKYGEMGEKIKDITPEPAPLPAPSGKE